MTAATGGGGAALDPATAALRHMMRSGGDEAARQRMLLSLLTRKLVVATWPGAADAVRTLTNRSGQQAMPLFTGVDVLRAAATRFGWIDADGSLSFRELPAREALRSGLQNLVHFVVIDLGTEHATEFARAEIERVLKPERDPEADAPRNSRPTRAAEPAGLGASQRARPLHDIATPFGVERTTQLSAMPPSERTPAVPASRAPLPPRATAPGVMRTRRPVHTAPFDKSAKSAAEAPEVSTAVGIAPPHPSTVPPELVPKRASDPAFLSLPPLPDSLPPPLTAAPAPSRKPPPPPPASSARGLRGKPMPIEVAAVVPASRASPDDANQDIASASAMHEVTDAATLADPSSGAEDTATSGNPADPRRFTAPRVQLPDAVLSQLSDVLRKYPEVEWACEISDGSLTPAIGLRIAPSFMARADEIRAGLASVASASGTPLSVSVLTDRDRMREARAEGHAFFPWRRRGKKA